MLSFLVTASPNKKQEITFRLLVFSTFPGVLIFSTLDFSAVYLFFTVIGLYYIEKPLSHLAAIKLGVILFLFSCFSFIAFVLFLFLVFDRIRLFVTHQNGIRDLALNISCTIITGIFAGILFVVFTNFNIVTCFTIGVIQNHRLMGVSGFDNVTNYLFRSSGNILGWFFTTGLAAYLIDYKNKWFLPLIGVLFLCCCSGLFFMETERIFIPLLPVLALVVGSNKFVHSSTALMYILVVMCLCVSIYQESMYLHCV